MTTLLEKKVNKLERFIKLVCREEWEKFNKIESFKKIIKPNKDKKLDTKETSLQQEMKKTITDGTEELEDSYQRTDEIIPSIKYGLKHLLIDCYTSQIDPQEYFMNIFEEIKNDVLNELSQSVHNNLIKATITKPITDEKEIEGIMKRFDRNQKALEEVKAPNLTQCPRADLGNKNDKKDFTDIKGMPLIPDKIKK
jgi:hypothetical protein